ncbi:MAG: NFACT family protein [Lachnospiraceae bacterium]|nr:NFACT family protein [Lachnospiraceae bacterium]
MAFDGITVASLVSELKDKLMGGRLFKIAQPENDELQLTIKVIKEQYKLLISAGASLPLMYLTDTNKTSPLTAPNFCMLLRKHINNGKIIDIYQPGLERIVNFKIEHYNEMGDLCEKILAIELMGKHSNIIFMETDGTIIDSIKHVNSVMSSVRQVLPGRTYFIPDTMSKCNPLSTNYEEFYNALSNKSVNVSKAIYTSYTGISPIIAEEICYRANIDSDLSVNILDENSYKCLYNEFDNIIAQIKNSKFTPNIIYKNDEPIEFSPINLKIYSDLQVNNFDSISDVLNNYYAKKNIITRIRQKSYDIRKIVTTTLEKDYKKYELQLRQLKDTEKRDKYKVYGELITAYGYGVEPGSKSMNALNYYTNEEITIPLDETISVMDNAKKYFDKYTKLKRTSEALESIVLETKSEIDHLESVLTSLDMALTEDDLKEIKEELIMSGYIKRKGPAKKEKIKNEPYHYISSDGFDMYVGKNNLQNEEITFKLANGGDWWFHSKNFPGSHVIVKTNGQELPDSTFEEAAKLAAYYSKGRDQDKVEIDYIERKHVKKVAGAKPGFVIYHTNYSMAIEPDIRKIEQVN